MASYRRFLTISAISLTLAVQAWCVDVKDFQARIWIAASGKSIPFRLFVPKDYQASVKYPVMLTLHGYGERGTDNTSQLAHEFNLRWAAESLQAVHPSFVIAPQCPAEGVSRWVDVASFNVGAYDQGKIPISDELQAVVAILDSIGKEFSVDQNRIYVSGLSMGGFAAWDLITRYPTRFAAAVPVCGAGDTSKATLITKVPVWAFHAADDPTVTVAGSRNMVSALTKAGKPPEYTEYPSTLKIGHASWVPAGKTPGLNPWVFSQTRATTSIRLKPIPAAQGESKAPGWQFLRGALLAPLGMGLSLRVDGMGRLRTVN